MGVEYRENGGVGRWGKDLPMATHVQIKRNPHVQNVHCKQSLETSWAGEGVSGIGNF